MKRSKIKHSRSNQVFYIFNTIFWIIFMFLIIYPLYLVCIASVSQLIYLYDIKCGHQYYRDIDSSIFSFQTEISWKGSNQYVLCHHNVL